MKIEYSVEELKQLLKIITLKENEIKITIDGSIIAKNTIRTPEELLNMTVKELSETSIEFFCGNNEKGSCKRIEKSEIVEEISKILKNEEVERIDVIYK